MSKQPLTIKHLKISRSPGLPHGIELGGDPEPGINVVYGPNASGKSSAARAMRRLISASPEVGLSADATLESPSGTFRIALDSGRVEMEKDGNPTSEKPFSDPDEGKRHVLAVHELLVSKEEDLAREIVKKSAGGYDIDLAAEALGYSPNISKRNIGEAKAHVDAREKVKSKRGEQQALKSKEESLGALERDMAAAQQQLQLKELYEREREYRQRSKTHGDLLEELGRFPEVMEKLRTEDAANIPTLANDAEETRRGLENDRANHQILSISLQNLDIGEAGVPERKINELGELAEALKTIGDKINSLGPERDALRDTEAKICAELGVDVEDLEKFNPEKMGGLDRFFQDCVAAVSTRNRLEAEALAIDELYDTKKPEYAPEQIRAGIQNLKDWLAEQEPTPSEKARWPYIWGTVFVLYFFVAATLLHIPPFFNLIAFVIAALVFIVCLVLSRNRRGTKSAADTRRSDYEKSPLPPVETWNTEGVGKRLADLYEMGSAAGEAEGAAAKRGEIEKKRAENERKLEALSQLAKSYYKGLDIGLGNTGGDAENFLGLYWFLKGLTQWWELRTKRYELDAQIPAYAQQRTETLEKFNAVLAELELAPAAHAEAAAAAYDTILSENRTHAKVTQERNHLNDKIAGKERELAKFEGDLKSALERLGITREEIHKVGEWADLLPDFQAAQKRLAEAAFEMDRSDRDRRSHAQFAAEAEGLELQSDEWLENSILEIESSGQDPVAIRGEISGIKALIDEKKRTNDLQRAQLDLDNAVLNLQKAFEENLSSLTGHLITEHLREQSDRENRPEVFDRANAFLSEFTAHRYALKVDNHTANFQAYDNVLQRSQPLKNLSSGTRVQLLLAVKLAFAEVNEGPVAIPIIADELLANSDEERAAAIIRAFVALAEQGRQIFYFTAQADEVSKWKAHLQNYPDFPAAYFSLRDGKSAIESYELPEYLPKFQPTQIQPPNGMSHSEYRHVLGVDAFHPGVQKAAELPLWYLLEDVDELYELAVSGIHKWGQYQSYLEHRNKQDAMARYKKPATLLDAYGSLLLQGRSKPVTADDLRDSGAVTENHMERVTDKLREMNGNPEALIEALRNKEVSRFRESKIDELEAWFEDNGFIDKRAPLDAEEIRIRCLAIMDREGMGREEGWRFLERVTSKSGTESEA